MIRSSLESHLAVVKRQPLLASFFALGVLNNVTYVIMIASSPEIAAQSIGTVYFCAVAPAVAIKFSSQYWFDKVTYSLRMMACAIWMVLGFVLVAFGTSIPTKLLGVVCCSLQSALGWSSGTGIAGILGYVVVAIYLSVLGLSFEAMLWSALLVLPTAWSYVYMFRIHGKFEDGNDVQGSDAGHLEEGKETDDSAPRAGRRYALEHHDVITLREWIKELLPYSMPLFLVYFAEYACQSGVWITIGFPPDSEEARKQFYSASNTMYQVGVFLSRSSGAVFQLGLWQLPWLAGFQFALLLFFIAVSALKIFYGWWLLAPAFVTGIFGGLCYVNAFRLLAQDSSPAIRERNMAFVSAADSFGVGCADIVGILLQQWLSA